MRRVMEIVTPLGADVLLFHSMNAREELSRLSEFDIDLLSERGDINLDTILGKNVTVKFELHDDSVRHFNGYVTRFEQVGMHGRYHAYHATVRPWLWFLTRTADCRIFQDMTVPEIIKQVFDDHTVADMKNNLTDSYRKWTYCVQYRETDFNFVSRLMEQEGIYYFFTHAEGRHTLVLADAYSAHEPVAGYETLPFIAAERVVRPEQEYISQWDHAREIHPGKYELDDYDFERPSVDLAVKSKVKREHALADYEVYDYPGEYEKTADGDQYAHARIDELQARFELARGDTNARGLSVGRLFKLTGQPRVDQNREYLVMAATHALLFNAYETQDTAGASCSCGFTALNSHQQFRPQRATPKPIVQGPQTAIVVGPTGDEIYTDKYGRVKVQFHWDRYGKKNENSSCWIRPSHPWAGKNWGMVAIPRIGQEVIVDFLEGDPDQPIITGRVYNAEQMPPYALPANMTQTGMLSRSSKSGTGANANELRFEDKKDAEQIYLHAEKNQDIEVEKDETHWVGHDRKKTIDHDETTHVKHDRSETVDNDEAITIGKERTTSIGEDDALKVGKNLVIDAGDSVTIQTGSASITMNKDGTIVIKGKDITIEGSGAINVTASSDVVMKGLKIFQN